MSQHQVTIEDFEKIDIRVGVVSEITSFTGGKYSTHILMMGSVTITVNDKPVQKNNVE